MTPSGSAADVRIGGIRASVCRYSEGCTSSFHKLLQGFRVVAVVQPRFFSHFREVQQYFSELGLPKGMLEILPGITQARVVAQGGLCLQFMGSSAMFRGLVSKAYDLGNFGLQHVGEVCGQCQQRLLNRKQASKIYLLQCASRVSVCFVALWYGLRLQPRVSCRWPVRLSFIRIVDSVSVHVAVAITLV